MIIGEYAILEGAEAVVAAVDRRVYATLSPTGDALPPEAAAAQREAEGQLGVTLVGQPVLDVNREKLILEKLQKINSGPLSNEAIEIIFKKIIEESRNLESEIAKD